MNRHAAVPPSSKTPDRSMRWTRRFRPIVRQHLLVRDASEIDHALDELHALLERYEHFRQTIDRWANPAQQAIELADFMKGSDWSGEAFFKLDPGTQGRVMAHYAGGGLDLLLEGADVHKLRAAVSSALIELGPPSRGRPAASGSLARRQLGLGLAWIFAHERGQPTRNEGRWPGSKQDKGAFRVFVDAVLDRMPKRSRPSIAKGTEKTAEWMVRETLDYRKRFTDRLELARKTGREHLINPAWGMDRP